MSRPHLALFDLDHTLLPLDSDYEWGEFTIGLGWCDATEFKRRNAEYEGKVTAISKAMALIRRARGDVSQCSNCCRGASRRPCHCGANTGSIRRANNLSRYSSCRALTIWL